MDKRKRSDEDGDMPAKRQKITTTPTTTTTITVETTTTTTTTVTTEHTEPNTPAATSIGVNTETAFGIVEDPQDRRDRSTRMRKHEFLTTDVSSSYPESMPDSKADSFSSCMLSESDGGSDGCIWVEDINSDVLAMDLSSSYPESMSDF